MRGPARNRRKAGADPIRASTAVAHARAVERECLDAPPLSQWIEHPPSTDATELRCANGDPCDWHVTQRDGAIAVAPRRDDSPEQFASLGGVVLERHVDDGWLVASNRGEFGGDVFWFSEDTRTRKRLGGDRIVAMIDVASETWLFAGLDHLMLNPGHVYRAEHAADRTWALVKVADLAQSAYAAVSDGRDALVVTTTQLVRVHRDGLVEKLHESPSWLGLYPTSIVIDRGTLFIGARHIVIRLTPTKTGFDEMWRVRSTACEAP